MKQPPLGLLLDWVANQRWFAAHPPAELAAALTEVASAGIEDGLDVGWWILELGESTSRARLLLAIACCRGAAPVEDAIRIGETSWFDALSHPTTAAHALGMLGGSGRAGVDAVWLDDLPLSLSDLRTTAVDQSNTSIHTPEHVLKVFRRLRSGRNPEIEIGRALRSANSVHVAPFCGWATIATPRGTYDVLAVHGRIDGADGFALAIADAQRFVRGEDELHFPGAAYELGIALGAVHADLAAAFGEQTVPAYGAELSRRLLERLNALDDVVALAPFLPSAKVIFADLASSSARVPVHRIHGDLHLGQTLFTDDGWRFIDFEGEPRRKFAERTAPDTGLRDVAGMLRSFDYAARWNGGATAVPGEWRSRVAGMFLEGYHLQRPDAVAPDLLDALVLDKALYEVAYETAYRPQRVSIPLAAVAAICGNG